MDCTEFIQYLKKTFSNSVYLQLYHVYGSWMSYTITDLLGPCSDTVSIGISETGDDKVLYPITDLLGLL